MTGIERLVLSKLADGPRWSQSFRAVKPVVIRLVASGHIQRIAPDGASRRNMLAITPVGIEALGPKP